MINDFVKKQYNALAENYGAGRDQFQNIPYLEKLQALLNPGSQILDVGCGSGVPIDRFFIENGHAVLGIDISEKQIELAQKNVPEARYKVADMSRFVEAEYTVDAIVSFYAIFHTNREEHLEILKKLYSFLKPGGYLLITMGVDDWDGKETNFFGGEMQWSQYNAEKNNELVQEAGFRILLSEVDTSGGEKHLVILGRKK